jgi:predicted RNase H-like HicB family nuclease
MDYLVAIEKGDNSYGAYVPDLPGWWPPPRHERKCFS